MTIKPSVGFIASGLIAFFGVRAGAPLEAIVVFIVIGTAIEFAFIRKE